MAIPSLFCCQQVTVKEPEEIYDTVLGKAPWSLLYVILLGISFFIKFQFYLRFSNKHKVLKKYLGQHIMVVFYGLMPPVPSSELERLAMFLLLRSGSSRCDSEIGWEHETQEEPSTSSWGARGQAPAAGAGRWAMTQICRDALRFELRLTIAINSYFALGWKLRINPLSALLSGPHLLYKA